MANGSPLIGLLVELKIASGQLLPIVISRGDPEREREWAAV